MDYSDDYLDAVDMEELCQRLDITLDSSTPGENRKVLCPYHVGFGAKPSIEHDFGSCGIYTKGNYKGIHCFVCGKSYSAAQLVMDKFSISYSQAVQYLGGDELTDEDRRKLALKRIVGDAKSFAGFYKSERSESFEFIHELKPAYASAAAYCEGKPYENILAPKVKYIKWETGLDLSEMSANVQNYILNSLQEELVEATKEKPKTRKELTAAKEKLKIVSNIKAYKNTL